eukprot:9083455-Lingulodinium_polyedra.AAC.1
MAMLRTARLATCVADDVFNFTFNTPEPWTPLVPACRAAINSLVHYSARRRLDRLSPAGSSADRPRPPSPRSQGGDEAGG